MNTDTRNALVRTFTTVSLNALDQVVNAAERERFDAIEDGDTDLACAVSCVLDVAIDVKADRLRTAHKQLDAQLSRLPLQDLTAGEALATVQRWCLPSDVHHVLTERVRALTVRS